MKKLLTILLFIHGAAQAQTSVNANTFSGFVLSNGVGDIAALEAGIAGLPTTGYYTVIINSGQVDIEETFEITRNYTTIQGAGADLTIFKVKSNMVQTSFGMIRTVQSVDYNATVPIEVVATSNQFTLANASTLLDVGDLVYLNGPLRFTTETNDTYDNGMLDIITAINGSTVTVKWASPETYTATAITTYTPKRDINIDAITLDLRGRKDGRGIWFDYAYNCKITNSIIFSDSLPPATVTEHLDIGVQLTGIDLTIENCYLHNINGWIGTRGSSYVINCDGSGITSNKNYIRDSYNGMTSGGRVYFSQGLKYTNNTVYKDKGGGGTQDFHGNTAGEISFNNIFSGPESNAMINVRYKNTWVHHNTINIRYNDKDMRVILLFENPLTNIKIDSNYLDVTVAAPSFLLAPIYNYQTTPITDLKMRGNVFVGGGVSEITEGALSGFEFTGNFLKGNTASTGKPPTFRVNNTTTSGSISNNTWVYRANYPGSDFALFMVAASSGNLTLNNNKLYYEAAHDNTPLRFDAGGYTISNTTKYSSNSSLILENNGAVNTKSNNVVLAATTSPAEPTHAGHLYNYLPVSFAGNDANITVSSVTLNGSGTDYYGTIVSYLWTKVGGAAGTITSPTAATTTVTGLTTGTHEYQLQVTDDKGGTATDIVQVIVGTVTNSKKVPIPTGNKVRFKKAF